jgi:hypothetical protein
VKIKIVGNVHHGRDEFIGVKFEQATQKFGSSDTASYHRYLTILRHNLGA